MCKPYALVFTKHEFVWRPTMQWLIEVYLIVICGRLFKHMLACELNIMENRFSVCIYNIQVYNFA